MTRSVAEVNAALFEIREMPYGLARTTAAAALAERVEADGPDSARAFTLFTLLEAYVWGGEVTKAYLPFTRLLRWWDEHPEHFDAEDAHSLFWSFKWMVGNLMAFPDVPAEQIERTLDDMERRYAIAGNGMDAVALQRFQWARERGAADTEEAYRAWVATPRDDYSHCEACEPGERADHLFATGRYEEGIRLLEDVLRGSPRCATEPGDMLSHLQLAYLATGDAPAAARTHRRALRHLDTDVTMVGPKGRHLEFLARTGNVDRAVRRLEEDQAHLRTADSPGERFGFLVSVAVATGALLPEHADRPLDLRDVPAGTVGELDAWARDEALALARAFDARNGGDATERRTLAAWERSARRVAVDLGLLDAARDHAPDLAPRTRTAPPPGPSGAGTASSGAGEPSEVGEPSATTGPPGTTGAAERGAASAPGADARTLASRAAELAPTDPVAAALHYRDAADAFQEAGHLADAGFALAEAAQLAAHEGDPDGAATAFRRALSLLHAGGVPPRYVGPVARAFARLDAGDADAALGAVERVLESLGAPRDGEQVAAGDADERAARREELELRDSRARVLATLGRFEEAATSAEDVAEELARAGLPQDAAHAFWLAGSALVAAGRPQDAVGPLESAVEGFAVARDRGARSRAGEELVEVLHGLGRTDDARSVAESLATRER